MAHLLGLKMTPKNTYYLINHGTPTLCCVASLNGATNPVRGHLSQTLQCRAIIVVMDTPKRFRERSDGTASMSAEFGSENALQGR